MKHSFLTLIVLKDMFVYFLLFNLFSIRVGGRELTSADMIGEGTTGLTTNKKHKSLNKQIIKIYNGR